MENNEAEKEFKKVLALAEDIKEMESIDVPGFNSVYFYFFKKKGNDCCKGFACKSAVPPAAAKAVSDMNFFCFFI